MSEMFPSWTWQMCLMPTVFAGMKQRSSTKKSQYSGLGQNNIATLHGPTLAAVMAYMSLDTSIYPNNTAMGGFGSQSDQFYMGEYPYWEDNAIHVVMFNVSKGEFNAAVFDENGDQSDYTLLQVLSDPDDENEVKHANSSSGSALFFSLMKLAMQDKEFSDAYAELAQQLASGFSDKEVVRKCALVLCDNLYRRIELHDKIPDGLGIPVKINSNGKIARMAKQKLQDGIFTPSSILYGTFQHLTPKKNGSGKVILLKDYIGTRKMSERKLEPGELKRLPNLPPNYVIPYKIDKICQHIEMTTTMPVPFRNILLRGNSGSGKSIGAKQIALAFGLPYLYLLCDPDFEKLDFVGGFIPKICRDEVSTPGIPTYDHIRLDPPSAWLTLTGENNPTVTATEVYARLLEVLEEQTASNAAGQGSNFDYNDTEFVEAIRNGYVVEIAELSAIMREGVAVGGLNDIMDDQLNKMRLPTGETLERHRDTIIVATANIGYYGTTNINQSVISRFHMVVDMDEPEEDELVQRAVSNTGCADIATLKRMAKVVKSMQKRCLSDNISDGACGTREYVNWVTSYMVCGDALEAAEDTIIAKSTASRRNQENLKQYCLYPHFPKAQ